MNHQTSGMVTPFAPAMAGRTARSISRWMRKSVAGDTGVMQILGRKIADSIRIDPHPRHARGSVGLPRPHPMLTDSCKDLCVVSMLTLSLRDSPMGQPDVRDLSHILQQFSVPPYQQEKVLKIGQLRTSTNARERTVPGSTPGARGKLYRREGAPPALEGTNHRWLSPRQA
jgi:hypothetical protein